MKNIKIILLVGFITTFSQSLLADMVLHDSFESGNMSTTDADGFGWEGNNATSIVTMNPKCNGLSKGDATVIYNNKTMCNGPISGRDWTAKDGNNSLRFRFGAGKNMSEQRFNLGVHYPDLWLRYFIRVPVNFSQGTLNNKFLALWTDTYDKQGTVTWDTRPDSNHDGGANLTYADGGTTHPETGATPFISVPKDRGRWMEILVHVKPATSATAHDGIIQLSRRWVGDKNFTKIHEKLNAIIYEPGVSTQGIAHGYLFGWANDPYKEDTEWLLDDLSVYNGKIANPDPVGNLRLK